LAYKKSWVVFRVVSYPDWPVLEFRLRVHWNEDRAMLKLVVPTAFSGGGVFCEVPGGAVHRPADGQEHVFSRWAVVEENKEGRGMALAIIGSGPHGLDFEDGEMRISVLRSAAYCHERGFKLGDSPDRKFMDQGVHEMRFAVTAGEAEKIRRSASALADWLSGPPYALAYLPWPRKGEGAASEGETISLFALDLQSIRLAACKRSWDGKALILRLHETSGQASSAEITVFQPLRVIRVTFRPFEIKTLRLERSGAWREADLISET
jgi:alpha-mannosidase